MMRVGGRTGDASLSATQDTSGTTPGHTRPSREERDLRRREAYEARCREAFTLRSAGLTYQQIAEQLGYTDRSGAAKAVAHAREMARGLTEDTVALELDRLDMIVRALTPKAMKGETSACNTLIRLSESRRDLLGLDPAKRLEILSTENIQAELERIRAEKARLAAEMTSAELASVTAIASRTGR